MEALDLTRVYAFRVGKGTGRPITESTQWTGVLEANHGKFRLIAPTRQSELHRTLVHVFLGFVPITLVAFLSWRVVDIRLLQFAGPIQLLLLLVSIFGFLAIIIIASAYVFLLMDMALVGYQARHPARVVDVQARLEHLGRFRHLVTIRVEGVDHALTLVGSRRSLQSALNFSENISTSD